MNDSLQKCKTEMSNNAVCIGWLAGLGASAANRQGSWSKLGPVFDFVSGSHTGSPGVPAETTPAVKTMTVLTVKLRY